MHSHAYTVNLESFVTKYFRTRWRLRKLILQKLVHTINANAVRGHSYEISLHKNLSYESTVEKNTQFNSCIS